MADLADNLIWRKLTSNTEAVAAARARDAGLVLMQYLNRLPDDWVPLLSSPEVIARYPDELTYRVFPPTWTADLEAEAAIPDFDLDAVSAEGTDILWSLEENPVRLRRVIDRAEADAAVRAGKLYQSCMLVTDATVNDEVFRSAAFTYSVPTDFAGGPDVGIARLRAENEHLKSMLPDAKWLASLVRGFSWAGEMKPRVEAAADRIMSFSAEPSSRP